MDKYKMSALIGTIVMGISSFAACLAENQAVITLGNIGLLVSIAVMSYGFSKWQP